MALLRAFKALRPTPQLASKVAALPYDVMSSDEARGKVKNNPYSFLHIDKAEIDLPYGIDPYDKKVYKKAAENLENMIDEGTLIKDEKDNLYIYRQTMGSHVQTGLVGCFAIDDYIDGIIKKHEETRKDKEEDRINHVKYCNANTGPIFLTYKNDGEAEKILSFWAESHEAVYNFTASGEIKHEVWIIDDESIIKELISIINKATSLYIADGHHRAASAVKVGKMKREEKPSYSEEEFNYFLGVLLPHDSLKIMDYNRVVKDLNNFSPEEFLDKIKEKFIIEEYRSTEGYEPEKKHSFGMYLENKWYKLFPKESTFDKKDLTDSLDVSILQNNILEPLLGIKDPRSDSRIDFVGGIRGLEELVKRVDEGMAVAFSLYPTSMLDIMEIADEGKTMPPKSTWFEPKLKSGLFIHELD